MDNTTSNRNDGDLEARLRGMILRPRDDDQNASLPVHDERPIRASGPQLGKANTGLNTHAQHQRPQRIRDYAANTYPDAQDTHATSGLNQQSQRPHSLQKGSDWSNDSRHESWRARATAAQVQQDQRPFREDGSRGRGRGRGNQYYRQSQQQQQHLQQQLPLDPNNFRRGKPMPLHAFQSSSVPQLFDPSSQPQQQQYHNINHSAQLVRGRQIQYLMDIAVPAIQNVEMSEGERSEKEQFLTVLSKVCRDVCEADPDFLPVVSLESFGSFRSGFANAGSDMDLVIVVKDQSSTSVCFSLHERGLPRALEKRLLHLGFGARLLSKTRVPIIKICEKPDVNLLDKLREEREKWDFLEDDQKYPHLHPTDEIEEHSSPTLRKAQPDQTASSGNPPVTTTARDKQPLQATNNSQSTSQTLPQYEHAEPKSPTTRRDQNSSWTRERKAGALDFPKDGVGIQCDINFFNPLGLHNTQLLRCYSLCDSRVQPIVLFVKLWAKRRKVNSAYSGTLSSYGYVLMVLHFLVNVAHPPVLPNLQQPWRPNSNCTAHGVGEQVDGWTVNYWREEAEIIAAREAHQLTNNTESAGSLLLGFFQYYSSLSGGRCFNWMRQVLSLRTSPRGILTKEEKDWVKASTQEVDGKRIQHRYLFAIEDPFELGHNVARTVTHNGIVAIRDEFRRAHRILQAVGQERQPEEELLAPLVEGISAAEGPETPQKPVTNTEPVSQQEPRQRTNRGNQSGRGNHLGTARAPPTQQPDLQSQAAFPPLGTANRRRGRP